MNSSSALPKRTHENLEVSFNAGPFRASRLARNIGCGGAPSAAVLLRTLTMKWETPKAVDFRFGMEITMYVSNR
jgi:coenzyme PQQ precursor peptide PqqA